MLVDSHCHLDRLDLAKYQGNLDLALAAAAENEVKFFLCPGVDLENSAVAIQLATQYQNVVAAIGVHPTEELPAPSLPELLQLGADDHVVAIGETGLDYAFSTEPSEYERQRQLFRLHLRAANELEKPVIVHSRAAGNDLMAILRADKSAQVGGVMHCFTESWEMALAALELGFYISFSGIITFRNAESLREVAKKVPLDRVLLETDAPYLAPVPMRGKPNEPAFLVYVAEALAILRGVTVAELAQITTSNFKQLFRRQF